MSNIRQLLHKWPVVIILLLLTLAALTAAVTTPRGQGEPSLSQVVAEEDEGLWSYRVVRERDGLVSVAIELASGEQAAIDAYAAAVAHAAPELFAQQKEVEGLVIFRRPLPAEELPPAILANKGRVVTYSLRWISADGERVTIFGMPSENEFLPRDQLALQTEGTSQMEGAGELRGFMVVTMRLDQALYDVLSKEPDVFMVDVGPAVVIQEMKARGAMSRNGNSIMTHPPIFWYLEDLEAAQR